MKVVFMGTPDFAVGTLEAIIAAGHEVIAVVTQPDKPKGRSGALAPSPVKECALQHGLQILQPERARDAEFIQKMKELSPEVIVVVAFGQILPAEIIHLPQYGCINVHASLLPKYRGASPIQWAVIDGCETSGVTTMLMDEGLDTGDILLVKECALDAKETGGSLFDRLSGVGAELLVETLDAVEKGEVTPRKQDESQATYVKMLKKSFGQMDFAKSAKELEQLIRGLNPWPSAYTYLDGKMLKIWDADVFDALPKQGESDVHDATEVSNLSDEMSVPGTIVKIAKNCFYVQCGDGILAVNEVQLEGKKRMQSGDFLRGNALQEKQKLG